MGALVLDFIAIFLWRGMLRIFLSIRSSKWLRTTGKIVRANVPRTTAAYIDTSYEFEREGAVFTGYSKVPFLVHSSADEYARSLQSGTPIIVRVNPQNPGESAFFTTDQPA